MDSHYANPGVRFIFWGTAAAAAADRAQFGVSEGACVAAAAVTSFFFWFVYRRGTVGGMLKFIHRYLLNACTTHLCQTPDLCSL